MHRKAKIRSVINKNETENKMNNFRGSFTPPVLCLELVIQPQKGSVGIMSKVAWRIKLTMQGK